MKKIYLIRHAESEANAAVDLDNPTYYYDAKITKRGEDQALKARGVLENINFDTFICSPLTRTLQTFSHKKLRIIHFSLRKVFAHVWYVFSVNHPLEFLKNEAEKYDLTLYELKSNDFMICIAKF